MALGDIKTFDIVYDGLILQVDAIDMGDGTTQFVVRCIDGFADINAIYWSDGDETAGEGTFDGFNAKKDSSLNMNGTGEAWDGGEKLSSTGLGKEGTGKATYLTAGETLNAFTANVSWDSLDTIGIRATSTSTAEGSIKGVADDPEVTEAPDISVVDAECVVEGGKASFTINLSNAYDYDIKIYYETGKAGDTASEGDDYTSGDGGYVIIKAGETSAVVEIQTTDDAEDEDDEEHFTLMLTKAEVNLDDDEAIELDLSDKIVVADAEGCIQDDDNGDPGPDPDPEDFPTWGQDISNITLIFQQSAGDSKPVNGKTDGGGQAWPNNPDDEPDGDGYYTVKIDVPGSFDDDLDNSIEAILAKLIEKNDFIDEDSDLLGVVIKGGQQTTQYFAYGDHNENGDAPDSLPAGLGFVLPGDDGNVDPTNAIDKAYTESEWALL